MLAIAHFSAARLLASVAQVQSGFGGDLAFCNCCSCSSGSLQVWLGACLCAAVLSSRSLTWAGAVTGSGERVVGKVGSSRRGAFLRFGLVFFLNI